jgi:hypothetical protein
MTRRPTCGRRRYHRRPSQRHMPTSLTVRGRYRRSFRRMSCDDYSRSGIDAAIAIVTIQLVERPSSSIVHHHRRVVAAVVVTDASDTRARTSAAAASFVSPTSPPLTTRITRLTHAYSFHRRITSPHSLTFTRLTVRELPVARARRTLTCSRARRHAQRRHTSHFTHTHTHTICCCA